MEQVNEPSANLKAGTATNAASPAPSRPRSVSISAPRGASVDPKIRSKSLEPSTNKVDRLVSDLQEHGGL